MGHPKITIVTPSYNQGQFLEQTILSVVGQQYPNLEYIIIDGGSNDNSVEIIKKYESQIAFWVSEKDGGQANAINKGFARSTGDIIGWINSDDFYLPGTLQFVADELDPKKPELLFGNCLHFFHEQPVSYGSDVLSEHQKRDLQLSDYIIQPSSFWTKETWNVAGPLDESLHFGFDWEWFIRAKKAGVEFKPQTRCLATYRIHSSHKTGIGGSQRRQELASIYGRHAGKDYERLFLECCSSRPQIALRRKWLAKLRLSRFEPMLLKLTFPRLFRGFRRDEIGDMMTMLGS